MKPLITAAIVSIGAVCLAVIITFGLAVGDLRGDYTVRLLWRFAGRAWTGLCGALPLLVLVAAVMSLWYARRWARVQAGLVYHKLGNLPATTDMSVRIVAENRNERAETAWAIFGGNVDRANGSGMKALLAPRPEDEILQLSDNSTREFTAAEVIEPDPANRPDTFIVGQKGSGKTNVLRYIINRYQEALPDAKFMILSTIASNWVGVDAITDPLAIYQALTDLHTEIETRDAAMKAAHVSDYHRWPAAPPLLVIIIDEAEATVEKLALTNPKLVRGFTQTLQVIVNTGRNFGMMFVVGTQTARTDVLDPSLLRNAGTLLMMRMDTQTAARFAVYGRDITDVLPGMEPGRAYNPQRNGYVTFPFVQRLRLPTASLLCRPDLRVSAGEETLLLAEDAEADGLDDADMPDGTTDTTPTPTAHNRSEGGGYQAVVPVVGPRGIPRIVNRRPPTAEEAAMMRAAYKRGVSMTALCKTAWGYKDGGRSEPVWSWMLDALENRI
jgi:hypothetical protein